MDFTEENIFDSFVVLITFFFYKFSSKALRDWTSKNSVKDATEWRSHTYNPVSPVSVEVDLWCFIRRQRWFCRLALSRSFRLWCFSLPAWCSRWSRAWGQSLWHYHLPRFSLWVAGPPAALSPQSQVCRRLHLSLSSTSHTRTLHLLLPSSPLGFQDLSGRGTQMGEVLAGVFWHKAKSNVDFIFMANITLTFGKSI